MAPHRGRGWGWWALPIATAAVVLGVVRSSSGGAEPAVRRVPEAGLTAAQARKALRDLTESDGHVAVAEYRAAVAAARSCLRRAVHDQSAGAGALTLTPVAWSADRFTLTYGFSIAGTRLDPRPLDQACQARHSRRVEAVFHLQRRADRRFVAGAAASLQACLDRAGLPPAGDLGPRSRFVSALQDPAVGEHAAVEARRCIGDFPAIADVDL